MVQKLFEPDGRKRLSFINSWYECALVPSLLFPQYRVITVANMTELEGKNSLLGTDHVHKTDQQQLIQGTVRKEGLHARKLYNSRTRKLSWRSRQIREEVLNSLITAIIEAQQPEFELAFIFYYKYEGACVFLFVRSPFGSEATVHAEIPSSRICDKRFFSLRTLH